MTENPQSNDSLYFFDPLESFDLTAPPATDAAYWIVGATRRGKTDRLIQQLQTWSDTRFARSPTLSTCLVFAATGDNRLALVDRIATTTSGQIRFDSATPLGFFEDEVVLFFPLLVQHLQLNTAFPLRLRPETEQELATRLWRPLLEQGRLQPPGVNDYFAVRRTLDLLQLAAASGVPHEEIAIMLQQGFADGAADLWETMGEALSQWRQWCLSRGLLTYGIVTELYWRYLLPHPTYQRHLKQRFHAVLVDDVDEYPAVARTLFEVFLDHQIPGCFTYNPNGGIRLGLGADPDYMAALADRCPQTEVLSADPEVEGALADWLQPSMVLPTLPETIQVIQTTSRSELLRQVAEAIVAVVQTGQAQPHEIAVIAPGLDPIARYTLREILTHRQISVRSLNDQHPLVSSPLIRALLTLLALIYPGLGRLLNREMVAEMLVLLSQWLELPASPELPAAATHTAIDPVRAGLLTDHCFVPDPDHPRLLPVTSFPRWDRLGYAATQTYEQITEWIATQHDQQQQRLIPSPVVLIDRAIQRFLLGGSTLPADQLAILREFIETAQHYWDVDARLRQDYPDYTGATSVGQFIQLLRDGTITADPYPVRPLGQINQVTLATIYQYRSERCGHRWQFWLDAGSPYWLSGGSGLFGAPLFLHSRPGRPWTLQDALEMDQRRLERQVLDLLGRTERVVLCYSELATNGQEQAGALLPLVNAATPYEANIHRIATDVPHQ